jgi:SAM-dependent methyltransferase
VTAGQRERVGRHYQGGLGEDYYAWHREVAGLGAALNLWKFAGHVGPGDVVVDFGCSGGELLAALPARRRIGVEVNAPALAAARARGIEAHASTAAIADATADVVISHHALEHTLNPLGELVELRRVLKPDGRLVLWLPLDDWRSQRRARGDRNHHLYGWTPLLLRNLLTEAGFAVADCRVVTHGWPPGTRVLARVLPRRAFDALARVWGALGRRRQLTAVASPESA